MSEKKNNVTKHFVRRIQQWLDEEMQRDPLFAETVKSKPQKTVQGACNYVLKIARDTGQCGWDDSEVYQLVRHFYDEDDINDPGSQDPSKIIVSGHVNLTAEEKELAFEQAKLEYKKQLEQKAIEEEQARKEKERKRLEERREQTKAQTLDLFGDI